MGHVKASAARAAPCNNGGYAGARRVPASSGTSSGSATTRKPTRALAAGLKSRKRPGRRGTPCGATKYMPMTVSRHRPDITRRVGWQRVNPRPHTASVPYRTPPRRRGGASPYTRTGATRRAHRRRRDARGRAARGAAPRAAASGASGLAVRRGVSADLRRGPRGRRRAVLDRLPLRRPRRHGPAGRRPENPGAAARHLRLSRRARGAQRRRHLPRRRRAQRDPHLVARRLEHAAGRLGADRAVHLRHRR